MAKRIRGSRSAHRPGGQAPARTRRSPDSVSTAAATGFRDDWDEGIEEAIDIVVLEEAAISFDERAAPVAHSRPVKRVKVKADSLDARVAAEDVYVREDLRRIAVVSAILIVSLIAAWVVFVPLDVLGLY
jgi:hypothetical protein